MGRGFNTVFKNRHKICYRSKGSKGRTKTGDWFELNGRYERQKKKEVGTEESSEN